MATLQKKRFDKPDEKGTPPKVRVDTVKLSNITLSRVTYEPGWRWTTHMKPTAGTTSCQKHHTAYSLSGRMAVKHDDGTQIEYGPGDVVDILPGHEGWVVGNEPVVWLEFSCPTCQG